MLNGQNYLSVEYKTGNEDSWTELETWSSDVEGGEVS